MSSFRHHIILLTQHDGIRACVISVVPLTFSFTIPFALIIWLIDYIFKKPLDKCAVIIISILTSSETYIEFLMRNSMLAPSMVCVIIENIIAFPRTHTCSCYGAPCYPAYVLPWSTIVFYIKNVARNSPPLRILDTSDTYYHHHSFLGPRVVSNRNTGNWTMMCEFKTSSNPITLKWIVDSFILILLFIKSPS